MACGSWMLALHGGVRHNTNHHKNSLKEILKNKRGIARVTISIIKNKSKERKGSSNSKGKSNRNTFNSNNNKRDTEKQQE